MLHLCLRVHGENRHQAAAADQKSTAGASLLAQVIVAKYADHLPLHRQAKMFGRHGVELPDQTLCGWVAQCAQLLEPLYERLKRLCAGLQSGRNG